MLRAHRLTLIAVFAAVTACSSSKTSEAPGDDVGSSDTAETMPDTDATVPDDVSADVPSAEDTSGDTTAPDAADSATPDAADSATPDAADSATPDAADTSTAETSSADTSASDTSTPVCGVTGKPCCGETAKICDTNSVCAAGTCVAAAGACVRPSDCTGVCGGPTLCDGKVCFACGVSTGTGALWSACTSSSQCASGVCDVLRGVCSSACAPGITGDADCTGLDPTAVCAAPILELSAGSGTVSGVAGLCARGCLRDADCPTSQSCRLTKNGATNRLDLTCMSTPSGASVGSGGSCVSADVCLRGSCLPITSGTLHCTSLCVTSADCAASVAKNCRAFSFYKQTIYGCGS